MRTPLLMDTMRVPKKQDEGRCPDNEESDTMDKKIVEDEDTIRTQ